MTPPIQRRNTPQKKAILSTLRSLGGHASAGAVWRALSRTDPAAGRATVFRALAQMASDGVVRRVNLDGREDCYDITASPHAHVVCRECGRVADVMLAEDCDLCRHIRFAGGFTVEDGDVLFTGLCPDCAAVAAKSVNPENLHTKEN